MIVIAVRAFVLLRQVSYYTGKAVTTRMGFEPTSS